MASVQAIATVGNTLRNLLAENCPRELFPGAQFKLAQTSALTGEPFTDLGVTIYLYRVEFSTSRRNLPPRVLVNGAARSTPGPSSPIRFKPSTPLDLHFLITAWARSAERQWGLLAWAIRTLEDTNVLPAGLLNQNAGSADGSSSTVFSDNESVELVGENLSLHDMVAAWEVAKTNQQPSASFVVRFVLIDSQIAIATGKEVQTRTMDLVPQV